MDFLEVIALTPLKWDFWTKMESNAAVTLQFEELRLNNYLFLKDLCIFG